MEVSERSASAEAGRPTPVHTGSLHWTLSLHLESDRLQSRVPLLHDRLGGDLVDIGDERGDTTYAEARMRRQRENQLRLSARYGTSVDKALGIELRNAIEPMFEDVAEREHLGVVEDYLLPIAARKGSASATDSRAVRLFLDGPVTWETEGRTLTATFEDEQAPSLEARLRRFWYVHADLSVSYHLSFSIDRYEHRPEHFYLISMLQKLVSPKEFALPGLASDRIAGSGRLPHLLPFRIVKIRDADTEDDLTVWQYVARLFEADFQDLHDGVTQEVLAEQEGPVLSAWDNILRHVPFVAVPGLIMPAARAMFYFEDRRLRDLVLPRDQDGVRIARESLVREDFFDRELKAFLDETEKARPGAIDGDVWRWLAEQGGSAIEGKGFFGIGAEARNSVALSLLFLAGFNQNIIDFLNQDASEVLDSLEPLYPDRKDELGEGFFARFANPGALITYVGSMRSLEAGRPYIGTCPYAFLVHVLTMHNEFLARAFERRSDGAVRSVRRDIRRRDWYAALERISAFRLRERERYLLYHSRNVFRYDTEKLVFEGLQKIRGLDLRHEQADSILEAANATTREIEAKKTGRYESTVRTLLAGIGLLATAQILINWSNCIANPDGASSCPPSYTLGWLQAVRADAWIAGLATVLMVLFAICILVLAQFMWTATPGVIRRFGNWLEDLAGHLSGGKDPP